MRQRISYISIDPLLAEWLLEKLADAPEGLDSAGELRAAIGDLVSGEAPSVLLAAGGEETLTPKKDEIRVGDLEIRPRSRTVSRGGQEISLTPKEFDILYFPARNRGEVFTKEQIYRAVWEDDYLLDDSNIMAFIRKLRKKIEPAPDAPIYILTIWGIGYKFNDRP